MEFDFSRLRRGERIAAIGGALLFIVLFFDWYNVSVKISVLGINRSSDIGVSAWDAFSVIDLYLLLTAVVAIGLAALTATQRTPALPVTASVITTVLGGLAVLLILFRILDTPGTGGSFAGGSVDLSPTLWAFVGLLVTAGITYGGYLSMREEGTTLDDVRAQATAAGAQARSAFEGAPGGGSSSAPPPPPAAPVAPAPPVASAPPEPTPPPAPEPTPPPPASEPTPPPPPEPPASASARSEDPSPDEPPAAS